MSTERSLLDANVAYFLSVVEHGGFSAAARMLHISQPSLSVAVKKLEAVVGAQLLHRGPRGVEPTAAGRVMIERAREAARTLKAACEEIDGLGAEPRGRFLLGCHESLGTYFLPGFMARFVEKHPAIEIDLANMNSREVEAGVVARDVDVVHRAPDVAAALSFLHEVGLYPIVVLNGHAQALALADELEERSCRARPMSSIDNAAVVSALRAKTLPIIGVDDGLVVQMVR